MYIDITLKVSPQMISDAQGNEKNAFTGHLGTHFDVMNKEFPLAYLERPGIVFDVSSVTGAEITVTDIDLALVQPDMFVAFHTGFIESVGYGSERYIHKHPQLANSLIDALLDRRISIIAVDFAGIRRGDEHTPKDQYCADRGVFIVENVCNLKEVLAGQPYRLFTANTYPVNFAGFTGLPCRVVAKV